MTISEQLINKYAEDLLTYFNDGNTIHIINDIRLYDISFIGYIKLIKAMTSYFLFQLLDKTNNEIICNIQFYIITEDELTVLKNCLSKLACLNTEYFLNRNNKIVINNEIERRKDNLLYQSALFWNKFNGVIDDEKDLQCSVCLDVCVKKRPCCNSFLCYICEYKIKMSPTLQYFEELDDEIEVYYCPVCKEECKCSLII